MLRSLSCFLFSVGCCFRHFFFTVDGRDGTNVDDGISALYSRVNLFTHICSCWVSIGLSLASIISHVKTH
jgi:hypothetical protein